MSARSLPTMPLSGAKNVSTLRRGSDGFHFARDNRRSDGKNAALRAVADAAARLQSLLPCPPTVTNQVCVARETRAKLLAMTEQGEPFCFVGCARSPLPRDSERDARGWPDLRAGSDLRSDTRKQIFV